MQIKPLGPLTFDTQDAVLSCDGGSIFVESTGGPNGDGFYLGDMPREYAKALIRYIANH